MCSEAHRNDPRRKAAHCSWRHNTLVKTQKHKYRLFRDGLYPCKKARSNINNETRCGCIWVPNLKIIIHFWDEFHSHLQACIVSQLQCPTSLIVTEWKWISKTLIGKSSQISESSGGTSTFRCFINVTTVLFWYLIIYTTNMATCNMALHYSDLKRIKVLKSSKGSLWSCNMPFLTVPLIPIYSVPSALLPSVVVLFLFLLLLMFFVPLYGVIECQERRLGNTIYYYYYYYSW